MAELITVSDLAAMADILPERAQAMIDDAQAMARVAAPCLKDATDPAVLDGAKAVLRRAILRWHETGAGVRTQLNAGPFGQTVEATGSRGLFLPSEIVMLRDLCKTRGAFTINMMPRKQLQNPLQGAVINAQYSHEPLGEGAEGSP